MDNSRRWIFHGIWFGNALMLLGCLAMLTMLATYSLRTVRLVVPRSLIINGVSITDSILFVFALPTCFLRKRIASSQSRREWIMIFIYFLTVLVLLFTRLFLLWRMQEWISLVREASDFSVEKMVFVNVSLASGQYVEILANADGLEFDQHVEGYVRRIGPERWIAVQDKLNCCGYISTANATMNLSEYSDWATGSRCPLDLEVPIDCSGPLRVENRVQTRKISTVSILLAVVQLLTLVLVFEIVRSYRQIQSTKTKTG